MHGICVATWETLEQVKLLYSVVCAVFICTKQATLLTRQSEPNHDDTQVRWKSHTAIRCTDAGCYPCVFQCLTAASKLLELLHNIEIDTGATGELHKKNARLCKPANSKCVLFRVESATCKVTPGIVGTGSGIWGFFFLATCLISTRSGSHYSGYRSPWAGHRMQETLLCFGHGCSFHRMQSNMNVTRNWTWMLRSLDAVEYER